MHYRKILWVLVVVSGCAAIVALPLALRATDQRTFAAEAFREQWRRTDALVAEGRADYSWYWGPAPRSPALLERDDDAPGGKRLVVYYDKGRMELPLPLAGARAASQTSFGRLVAEMVSGNVQLGSQRLDPGPLALIPVAGDLNDPLAPTYAAFARLTGPASQRSDRPAESLDRSGSLRSRPELAAAHPETAYAAYDPVTGHNVPRVFASFLERRGLVETPRGRQVEQVIDPLAVVGRPISEAYWADLQLNGRVVPVLVQLFERRVLTYNPLNPASAQVEMGNAGLHYYLWRYAGTQPRAARQEELLAHFENGDQALSGNYWFSFDDRGSGGSSVASNRLITPGAAASVQAMRFEYVLADSGPVNFTALAVNLVPGDGPRDLRGVTAIGFWARGSGRYQLRLNSAFTDKPFVSTFAAPGDWTWIEIPVGELRNADGFALEAGLSAATRIEVRPARAPQTGFLDLDDLVLIRGATRPTIVRPGLPLIDDFEDGDLVSTLDTEWFTYSDQQIGGSSVAELAVVPRDNGLALRFRGSFNNPWGESYLGMGVPLAPAGQTLDLSNYTGVELSVRTDGQHYLLRLTSATIKDDRQYQLVIVAPPEWMTLYIPFSLLQPAGVDQKIRWETARTQIQNLIITPADRYEAFQLLIDDIRLVKR
ncbi:MAG: CIA30 family protein [Chloroflexaceae bacterium]